MDYIEKTVEQIRAFNRFYTVHMELLGADCVGGYSAAETRILYELYRGEQTVQGAIAKRLRLDKGYLSRTLKRLLEKGLAVKTPSRDDGRSAELALTAAGKSETERLIELTNGRIAEKIKGLTRGDCGRLCRALCTAAEILSWENG